MYVGGAKFGGKTFYTAPAWCKVTEKIYSVIAQHSGNLNDIRGLRSLLTLCDFELDLIAFLQALVAF
jgi:hypothetical protein